MSKRHTSNTNLTVISNGQYQGLNVYPRLLSAEYLDAILQTLQAAMNEHPRTLMVRFDLHLPQLNFLDSPVVYDSTVISKFFKSLDAKIQHNRLIKGREGKRVHPCTLRYIQNLSTKIVEAWASALGLDDYSTRHLVHFPEDTPVYYLNRNAPNYPQTFASAFFRLSYLAKLETKHYGDRTRSFGCSRI